MSVLHEYKCPCCGGGINFDSTVQKLKCPYCDTEFEIETLNECEAEMNNSAQASDDINWNTESGEYFTEDEAAGFCTFICNSCGGEIVGEETTAATSCPFCGNPVVIKSRLSGSMRPDLVIPFKLDKKAAKEGLVRHLSGKPLLPKMFKDENHIDEIRGMYLPFWLFDSDAEADVSYRATKVRVWHDRNFNYTETSHFLVRRRGQIGFDHIPVDGSSKMANDLMESIEPFDLSDAVDFNTAYLAGFLADKYDVSSADCVERANERVRNTTQAAFTQTVQGYSSVVPEHSAIKINNGRVQYALFPVWMLTTHWHDNDYTFVMNGQSGKFVGDLPTDGITAAKWLFGLTVGIGAVVSLIMWLMWNGGIL